MPESVVQPHDEKVFPPAPSDPASCVPPSAGRPLTASQQQPLETLNAPAGGWGAWKKDVEVRQPPVVGRKKVSPARPLKPSQERFIAAFTDPSLPTFGNAKQSYLKAHPLVTEGSAEVLGSKTLGNVRVRDAVVGSGEALTLEKAIEHLKWNVDETKAHHRYADHREVIKVWLQATGHWVEKREQRDVETPVSSQELAAELQRRCSPLTHKDL